MFILCVNSIRVQQHDWDTRDTKVQKATISLRNGSINQGVNVNGLQISTG